MTPIQYRSLALKKFWINLREVGTLISLSYPNEVTSRQRETNECLSRAAILLLCSHIEAFFEDLIIDVLRFHENNQTSIDMLPIHLKVIQIIRKPLSENLVPEKKWTILESISQSSFMDKAERCSVGMFNANLHLKGFASPGEENIENLFKGVGVLRVWDLIQVKAGTNNLKISLNNFVNRRNNITHGGFTDKPTIGDVKTYIRDVCKVTIIFNDIVTKYLTDDFNVENPWQVISPPI